MPTIVMDKQINGVIVDLEILGRIWRTTIEIEEDSNQGRKPCYLPLGRMIAMKTNVHCIKTWVTIELLKFPKETYKLLFGRPWIYAMRGTICSNQKALIFPNGKKGSSTLR